MPTLTIEKGHCGLAFMPDGKPAPSVLTAEEAADFLRLNRTGIRDPLMSLRYYRERGLLRGVKIGLKLRYRLTDLLEFLDRLAEEVEK